MNQTERNIYRVILDLARVSGEGTVPTRLLRRAEAARRRGLLRKVSRGTRQPVYRVTERGSEWLPGAMREADDLRVEVAAAHAPSLPYPAVTIEFLALLKACDFVWQLRGIYRRETIGDPGELRHPGALASYMILWQTGHGPTVWWLGDSAARCLIEEKTYWALRRGEALSDGSVRVEGKVLRLLPWKRNPELLDEAPEAILWDVAGRCRFVP